MRPAPRHIAVLGAGSWGTTFAKVLAESAVANGHQTEVQLWARREEVAEEISTRHTNSTYLGSTLLPAGITASADITSVVSGAELVILALPAQSLREQVKTVAGHIGDSSVVVSLIKGLERGTDMRMSQVIEQELRLPADQIAVVSGPNLAMEIAQEEPTASVAACVDPEVAEWIASLCSTAYFRPYTNTDVVGVETAGVVKNIIALAVGICDGQSLGDNSKASVITRGLAETTRLATALGAQVETFLGLAGLGDLVATCASPLSRNRTAGRLLGEGLTSQEVSVRMTQTAEGMKSASAVLDLAQRHQVEMPICQAVTAVLNGSLAVENIASLLLSRTLKSEGK